MSIMTESTTDRGNEITYKDDDIIVFGSFDGNDDGTYEIEVHRNKPDEEGNREIYSVIHSYDKDGNDEGTSIEDFPDYVATARRIWGAA